MSGHDLAQVLCETSVQCETFAKIQKAYGESSLSRAQVFLCLKAFSEGWEMIEDEAGRGRLSTANSDGNIDKVRALVRSDRLSTVRMIGDELCRCNCSSDYN
uniref:Mos1 transposase HTH domain-containing protein n=1 Tax=Cacopsylla melanoneura TaxID=428564 RepID=A0A8D8VD98_9HEMI